MVEKGGGVALERFDYPCNYGGTISCFTCPIAFEGSVHGQLYNALYLYLGSPLIQLSIIMHMQCRPNYLTHNVMAITILF